ncbi:MAG: alanine racemase [Candidatus Paceibacterota bacterium]
MKKAINHKGLRTWIEIDRRAIRHNYKLFRSLIPKTTKLLSVVKSNAYGHSHIDFSKEVETLGIDYIAVDSIVEGLSLRKSGVRCPVLVLGHTLHVRIKDAAVHDIRVAVSSITQLHQLQKETFKRPLKIHIKVDTGLHRQGFTLDDLAEVRKFLEWNKKTKRVVVEGLFTHFAQGKDPLHPLYTKKQLGEFDTWVKEFHSLGVHPILHTAATGPTLVFPESHFDMVRIGIGLYGIWPDEKTKKYLQKKYTLKPILSWKAVVSEVKQLPKGSKIGYDSTEILKRSSVVAVCPIGYWHGFPRALSSHGFVVINGKRAKVLGRVSMDMISVDVTGIKNVKVGSIATIIGKDGKDKRKAEDIADSMNASTYEFLTRINPLIKRLYI